MVLQTDRMHQEQAVLVVIVRHIAMDMRQHLYPVIAHQMRHPPIHHLHLPQVSGSKNSASDLENTAGSVDQTHCDKKGYPSCYDLGYSDGQNAPGTSCPSGHSETYCNGYEGSIFIR